MMQKPRIRIRPKKTGAVMPRVPRIKKGGFSTRKMKGLPKF